MEESTPLLIQRYRDNDPDAFEQLVARYHSLVFGICMRFLRHRQDAEDATQETFSRLAKHLSKWDSGRPFEPWLKAIAGNRCRTYRSRFQNREMLPLTQDPSAALDQVCAAAQPNQDAAREEVREELRLALRTLPANHRNAFQLFHEHSLGYAEIAAELECPIGTVKTWVHRARVAVMQQLLQREVVNEQMEKHYLSPNGLKERMQ
ncbi:ECF RNA polymerase sigma factor SigW [Novipirellula aureliae]|uniref:ECF RNA polymerase sigma factor SigW n=1 Tax=Novipirellula aureliae TaxID=2527966 RepID=A0A5C6E2C1_9BACT|nr:sigma-70 family RNA polymerase sigma factor [Novipirellula aureliae]TWU41526.1 ECF RNA polymerase sigma factor SigW [Novipirellula aureliae]